jgi:phosphatidylserine decarboxylase
MGRLRILWRIGRFERLNFVATNRIPRRLSTRLMGWLSRVEHPLVVKICLAVWQAFGGDLRLHEAKHREFATVHDCFVRELREGVRPVHPDAGIVVSPCDGIVGALGQIAGTTMIQAKGFSYALPDLVVDDELVHRHRNAPYMTLRLTSTMYHRFHAPDDCTIGQVIHVAGDVWNVNPAALSRVDRVFCRNERVIISARLRNGEPMTLVAVGAILVSSIHLHCVATPFAADSRRPQRIACSAFYRKGDELGYFSHGSTIIVLGNRELTICDHFHEGRIVRMGEALLRRLPTPAPTQ